jgi:4,5-dihydroxyphthalate decarboxylase
MNSNELPEIIIRGGDHEHVLGMAGDYANGLRLGYETMRLQDIFVAMLETRQFEVCEFSLANYIVLRTGGQHWLSAIPVFPFRAFRHATAITRRDSALTDLAQLAGKRVGVEDYSMTAAVWFRGLLRQEYDIDHRSIHWVSYAKQRLPLPRSASVEITHHDLEETLCHGGIDAMLGFFVRDSRLPPPQRQLRTILPHPQVVEQDYYRRTAIYPINHCVVIRNDALECCPALADTVYSAYVAAKARAYQRQLGSTLMPWGKVHWERTFELFQDDPLPYGLTPQNRRVVEQLAQDLHEQGFIETVPDIDTLFIVPRDMPSGQSNRPIQP